jgi:anti-sigma factor ChrR (cupin superfamily)
MTRHDELDDDAREQAALAALGALPPDEARAFAEHARQCAPCRAEYASLQTVVAELALLAPQVAPPDTLWLRLASQLHEPTSPDGAPQGTHNGVFHPAASHAAPPVNGSATTHGGPPPPPRRESGEAPRETQTWKRWSSDSSGAPRPFAYVAADDTAWEPTAVDGIEARKLFVDAAHDRVTMLVRMAAGTAYPGHVHATAEECFVLSGDLRTGTEHLHEGDYQRAAAGSIHQPQVTDGGCVLLLVSSLHDTLLPT